MAPILNEEEIAIDPYELLGVKVEATEGEIKSTYRKLSLKCHPDRNPDNPNAAQQFHTLSLALGMLTDPSKRSYVNNKLEEDRRKKEKYAVMEKKKRGLVDALLAREEEAKKAKVNAVQRHAEANEEEAIKEAGRKMREAMQKAHLQAQAPKPEETRSTVLSKPTTAKPTMTPTDLTLTLQFPPESASVNFLASTTTLEPRITSLYGPVNFIILKEANNNVDPLEAGKKKKKSKGAKAIVEFKESNWTGCWACWKDHVTDPRQGKPRRPLVAGTKAKWINKEGTTPEWIAWAESQQSNTPSTIPLTAPTEPLAHASDRTSKVSSSFAASFAASFPTAEERRQQDARAAQADAAKTAADNYENATLLKMRQLERERLEAEIRKQDEQDA
ncbi:hypothetical protein QFC22_005077 [Naganishia vaughanmartiniae]|uniref:Uncharacterized protein n=1 Tax=Naganishia vaughanmartiniae TaxID=1424756 RepID=A0ACC2WXU2_9TREE|nr:hypothetical protein QFC22_005077 [Naganishia vaughanmartiniae]